MTYRSLEMNVGKSWRNSSQASRRALCTSAWCVLGRIGMIADTASSVARLSAISLRNRSPRLRDTLARKHSMDTRHSTVWAVGSGREYNSADWYSCTELTPNFAHWASHRGAATGGWQELYLTFGRKHSPIRGYCFVSGQKHPVSLKFASGEV